MWIKIESKSLRYLAILEKLRFQPRSLRYSDSSLRYSDSSLRYSDSSLRYSRYLKARNGSKGAGELEIQYLKVSQGISRYLKVSQGISRYLKVSQGISRPGTAQKELGRWKLSISRYLKVSQNISRYLKVYLKVSQGSERLKRS